MGGYEKRGLEPASVLVGSLQIKIRGPFMGGQRREAGDSRLKPNIHDVALGSQPIPPSARGTGGGGREETIYHGLR